MVVDFRAKCGACFIVNPARYVLIAALLCIYRVGALYLLLLLTPFLCKRCPKNVREITHQPDKSCGIRNSFVLFLMFCSVRMLVFFFFCVFFFFLFSEWVRGLIQGTSEFLFRIASHFRSANHREYWLQWLRSYGAVYREVSWSRVRPPITQVVHILYSLVTELPTTRWLEHVVFESPRCLDEL